MPEPEFRRLLKAIKKGHILSDRETAAKEAPPSYSAHLTLDGHEYTVSVTPTQLEAETSE